MLINNKWSQNIKLWDIETGRDIFEFSNAHGDQIVTCMTFDDSGKRLITGGRDGLCKIWNYNNGHCLKILKKNTDEEITDVKYTKVYNNKFILNVGWDRRINIYVDDPLDVKMIVNPSPSWTDDIVIIKYLIYWSKSYNEAINIKRKMDTKKTYFV
jgi:WD40 repeat protein